MSKSETARNTRTADDFSFFLIFEQLTRKNIIAQMVSSNNKIVSSRFFEQSNLEQMIMTRLRKDVLKPEKSPYQIVSEKDVLMAKEKEIK